MSEGIDWSGKRARVHGAPVAELNAVVDRWTRARQASIPWFDPDDGGVSARVLVLLESPGPKTVRAGGTMMCSFDNPDTTNPALKSAFDRAGVDRTSCVKWNVVPWAVLDPDGHPAAPTSSILADSAPFLQEILVRLPDLEVVLVLGAKALDGYMRTTTLSAPARLVPVVAAPHPSARNAHATAVARQRLINAATSVAAHLDQG
ncbi:MULTISPECIES: uracil-DNA glycosylase [Nocardiaceae]|uniref:Uracil-DNA glycosylase n=1 Tax=Rhodococcoides kroppenstedtii TaxID=293050 RepID=A0ABS7NXF3_9NOCA|nr:MULTISPECIES: uracil-DNA glycosylase [Rhodococcus]AMY20237.1 hypothetical protein A3Q40_02874 [Rhodococcus sp. PBTS 1]MBY6314889.1 uracil-DNA glycosylase [Rhodococcus kroppenstedtii]MBY6322626.1 uracil-DNA glycosylase [Rhodococcus kroppenstedtii]MBY6399925.1 uracil-DNA glycosylase [Rhodococcus kroppenstedtii]